MYIPATLKEQNVVSKNRDYRLYTVYFKHFITAYIASCQHVDRNLIELTATNRCLKMSCFN